MAILIAVDGNHSRAKIIAMLLVRITGNQLRAGRALAGLTIEDLAARAQLHRQSVRKWEGSSNATPSAMTDHLCRLPVTLWWGEKPRFSTAPSRARNYDGTPALSRGELAERLLEIAAQDDDGEPKTGRRY